LFLLEFLRHLLETKERKNIVCFIIAKISSLPLVLLCTMTSDRNFESGYRWFYRFKTDLYMSLTVYKREAMLRDRIDRQHNPIIVQKPKLRCLFTLSLVATSDQTSGFSQGGAWQSRWKNVSIWKYNLIPHKYFNNIFYETMVYSNIHYAKFILHHI